MLIEDDNVIQVMVEDIVSQLGHQFTAASEGKAARDILTNRKFGLVIFDRRLPDIDGLLLEPMLRAAKKTPFIV